MPTAATPHRFPWVRKGAYTAPLRTQGVGAVAAVALVVAAAFVLVRLAGAAGGDVSRFVLAGDRWAAPGQVPASLTVSPGDGYDGQFLWRLAAAPTALAPERHLGVALDQPYRVQRVGYPYLAAVVALGGVDRVPSALVIVNLLATSALAALGASIALRAGRSSWWGLALPAFPGFVTTLSRDLAELTAAALLVGGVVAARRSRWWVTAALWSWGVVTREQLLVPVAAFGAHRAWLLVTRRARPGAADAAWALPAAAFATWQGVGLAATGTVPLRSGAATNLGPPSIALGAAVRQWGADAMAGHGAAVLHLALLAFLVGLVTVALRWGGDEHPWERWMLAAGAALALCLTGVAYDQPAELRFLADVAVLAWVRVVTAVAITARRVLAGMQGALLVATMALRTVAL